MTNRSKTLYVGFTSALQNRVWEHKNHVFAGFTDRYRVDRLVWYEIYATASRAIAREKQLKGWSRIKKIVKMNPGWRDLSEDWGKPLRDLHDEETSGPLRGEMKA